MITAQKALEISKTHESLIKKQLELIDSEINLAASKGKTKVNINSLGANYDNQDKHKIVPILIRLGYSICEHDNYISISWKPLDLYKNDKP